MTLPSRLDNMRVVRAPHGTELTAKSWLDRGAAAHADEQSRSRRRRAAGRTRRLRRHRPRRARLERLRHDRRDAAHGSEADETLLVQSGKPVGVFRTHADAPRVLIANSNLVPHWATWDHFHELDRKGLMMYGQMTAGSWIYIGSQGIVQGTYETFVEMGRRHYGGSLEGRWILTAGLGGMGGAQPLSATMAGASMLAVECRPSSDRVPPAHRLSRRRRQDARRGARRSSTRSTKAGKPVSVGLLGNAADVLPELVRRGVRPDIVTDQTSAHDPVNGYLPKGWTLQQWEERRASDPKGVERAARASMAEHVRAMLDFFHAGVPTVDYGNNIRQMALEEGVTDAFDFPGFVPAYIRPLFCRGIGPFRWAALSGDPEDIYRTDAKVKELIPDNPHLHNWLDMARAAHQVPGAAGAHLLGGPRRPPPARPRVQRDGGVGRTQGADRDRARPSRFRLGRLAQPRDRGDAGRLRRRLRLAAAQRAPELRLGRDLGVAASRRRRRHGLLPARRHGGGRRRHARGRARRVGRVLWNDPATGVDAPRRRRLRGRDRLRQGEGAGPAEPRPLAPLRGERVEKASPSIPQPSPASAASPAPPLPRP